MTSQRKAIRHFAGSPDGPFIAAAEFQRRVQIWNLAASQRVSSFDTILDFGGLRLELSPDGKICVAGSYGGEGVAGYDTQTGKEIWRRVELKKPQKIRMSADGSQVFCGFEEIPFEVLDLETGSSLPSHRAVKDLWQSPYDGCRVLIRKGEGYDVIDSDGVSRLKLPRKSFAALCFAFAPDTLCVSESGGPVTGYSLENGDELWSFQPDRGVHALSLAYSEVDGCFVSVTWTYQKGGNHRIVRLDPNSGSSAQIAEFSAVAHHFCRSGAELILSDGRRIDTMTGAEGPPLKFFATDDFSASEAYA